jgi:hypothetical protein
MRAIRNKASVIYWVVFLTAVILPRAAAGDAPQWMHALVGATLPSYDEKTNAVLLYSETNVTVLSADKIRTHIREAYKILRPEGRERGVLGVTFNPGRKITNLKAWCIPAQGRDYEVKEKDAIDIAAPFEGAELVTDVRERVLRIPAPDPGNIVGYEYEVEERPFWLQDIWQFQRADPVRRSRYSLQLPAGWDFKTSWLAHATVKPDEKGGSLQWEIGDVKGVKAEANMPPWEGLAGQMIVSFFPSGGTSTNNEFVNWAGVGKWYGGLVSGQMEASEPIKLEVKALASGKTTTLAKMQAIAGFVQHDIRYVAIFLGIGGFQPHAAPDVFSHRYGDCKDKATLLRTMLREIGVDSYHVLINTERGSITSDTPAHSGFNHVILAIKLPDDVKDTSLIAVIQHPKLGRILFFDPTYDELIPFGQIGGYLQANYGLMVTPDGGELVQLPQQPSAMNSIRRVGKLTLDASGKLQGDVEETRLGNRASTERWRQREVTKSADRIKPIESLLADSLPGFQITKASLINLEQTDLPFGFKYSFASENYAKTAGNLLLVRPRVLGSKTSGILETKEPRSFPVEFEGPSRDTDTFDIVLPEGYEVDELPPPMDADYSFGSYHSKTEMSGRTLHYSRAVEIKELSVPVNKMDDLKKFYRVIATDERNTAVLKPVGAGK